MMPIYSYEFHRLKSFSIDITKELCEKIAEAKLNIELSSGDKHKLVIDSPKVPSSPSANIRDLFSNLDIRYVESLKVFGEKDNQDILWRIEIWDNSGITGNTIHCREIQGLPEMGWKKQNSNT